MNLSSLFAASAEGRQLVAAQKQKIEAQRRQVLKEIDELEVDFAKVAPLAAQRVDKARAGVDVAERKLEAARASLREARAEQIALSPEFRVNHLRRKLRDMDPPAVIEETLQELRNEHSVLSKKLPTNDERATGEVHARSGEPEFAVYTNSEARAARLKALVVAMNEVAELSTRVATDGDARTKLAEITTKLPEIGEPILAH